MVPTTVPSDERLKAGALDLYLALVEMMREYDDGQPDEFATDGIVLSRGVLRRLSSLGTDEA